MAGVAVGTSFVGQGEQRVETPLPGAIVASVDEQSRAAQARLRPPALQAVKRWWIKSQPDGVPYYFRTDGDVAAWKLPEGEVPLVPKPDAWAPLPPPRLPEFGWFSMVTPSFSGHKPLPDVPTVTEEKASVGDQPGGPVGDQPGAGMIGVEPGGGHHGRGGRL